jgi:hypothetical protein
MAVKQELDANLQVRVPKAFLADLDAAAQRLMVNRADFIRLTLLSRVRPAETSPVALWGAA